MPELEYRITPVGQRLKGGALEHVVVRGAPSKSVKVWFGSEDTGWCEMGKAQARDLRDALDAALGPA